MNFQNDNPFSSDLHLCTIWIANIYSGFFSIYYIFYHSIVLLELCRMFYTNEVIVSSVLFFFLLLLSFKKNNCWNACRERACHNDECRSQTWAGKQNEKDRGVAFSSMIAFRPWLSWRFALCYLWAIQPFNWRSSRIFVVARARLQNGRWWWAIRTRARTLRARAMTWAAATAATRAVACRCRRFRLGHHVNWHRLALCVSSWRSTAVNSRCTPISPCHGLWIFAHGFMSLVAR